MQPAHIFSAFAAGLPDLSGRIGQETDAEQLECNHPGCTLAAACGRVTP